MVVVITGFAKEFVLPGVCLFFCLSVSLSLCVSLYIHHLLVIHVWIGIQKSGYGSRNFLTILQYCKTGSFFHALARVGFSRKFYEGCVLSQGKRNLIKFRKSSRLQVSTPDLDWIHLGGGLLSKYQVLIFYIGLHLKAIFIYNEVESLVCVCLLTFTACLLKR